MEEISSWESGSTGLKFQKAGHQTLKTSQRSDQMFNQNTPCLFILEKVRHKYKVVICLQEHLVQHMVSRGEAQVCVE